MRRRRIGGMFYDTDHRICYSSKSLTNNNTQKSMIKQEETEHE